VWKAATAEIRGQDEFTFELPAVEFCNSERPSGDKFQGENSARSTGALPPEFAHASKYQLSPIRGLIVERDSVAKIENSIMARRPDHSAP